MGSPGEIERVPLKVVPIYIESQAVEGEAEPEIVEPEPSAAPRKKTALLGILAIAVALVALALQITAITVATGGDYELGTLLGYLAVGVAVLAVLAGIAALILGRGRRTGIVAILLGIVANPLVLLALLRLAGGAQSS